MGSERRSVASTSQNTWSSLNGSLKCFTASFISPSLISHGERNPRRILTLSTYTKHYFIIQSFSTVACVLWRRKRKFKRCSKRAVDHFRKWLPIKNYLARLEICPTNLPNSKEYSLSNEISEVNLNAYKRILNWQPFMKKVHRKIMLKMNLYIRESSYQNNLLAYFRKKVLSQRNDIWYISNIKALN